MAEQPEPASLAGSTRKRSVRAADLTCTEPPNSVCGVAFSPKGSLLAAAGYDESLRPWDAVTGAAVRILSGHVGAVFKVAFSPDGTLLATGSWDKTSRQWA